MRLFKSITALSAVALAGDKFQATPTERDCLSKCKRDNECQGQEITKDHVPECISNCREICNDRKGAVISMLGRSSAKKSKAELRKATNVAARAEHREQLKAAQPAPMIKEIHEIRDEGDEAAELFLACLKNEKANLGCHGKGPGEAWDCKREMVDNCLDQNSDFEQYDSAAIADFVSKFRESEIIAENTKDYLKRKTEQEALMANDFVDEEPKVVTLGEKFDKNNKGKVKVGFVRRQQKESKNNIDTTDVALEHQAAALAYINQSNDKPAAPAADDKPAAAESEFSFANFEDEDNFEDAPIESFEEQPEFDFNFEQFQGDFVFGEEEEEAEEAELESEPRRHKKGHKKGGNKDKDGKDHDKDHDKHDKPGKDHDKDGKDKKKPDGARPALFTLTYKNKDGVDKAKQATKTAHGHKEMKERNQHKLSEGNEPLIERGLEGQSVRVEVGEIITISEVEPLDELRQTAETEAEDILAPMIITREVLGDHHPTADNALIDRGVPERVVQGPLTVTDAGYVQLNSIEERMNNIRVPRADCGLERRWDYFA